MELKYGDSLVAAPTSTSSSSSCNGRENTNGVHSNRGSNSSNDRSILPLRFLPEQWDNDETSIVGRLKTPLIQILGDTFLGPQDGQFPVILNEN